MSPGTALANGRPHHAFITWLPALGNTLHTAAFPCLFSRGRYLPPPHASLCSPASPARARRRFSRPRHVTGVSPPAASSLPFSVSRHRNNNTIAISIEAALDAPTPARVPMHPTASPRHRQRHLVPPHASPRLNVLLARDLRTGRIQIGRRPGRTISDGRRRRTWHRRRRAALSFSEQV